MVRQIKIRRKLTNGYGLINIYDTQEVYLMDTHIFHGISGRNILKLYCYYIFTVVAMLIIMVLLESFYNYSSGHNGLSRIHFVALIPFLSYS